MTRTLGLGLVLGLLFVIPALTVRYFAGLLAEAARDARYQTNLDTLEREFSVLFRAISPEYYVEKRFQRFCRHALPEGKPHPNLVRWRETAQRKWRIDFDVYVFGPAGNIIEIPGLPLKNKFLFQNLWKVLRDEGNEVWSVIQKQQSRFLAIMGPEFQITHLKAHENKAFLFLNRLVPQALFWKSSSRADKSGVMLIASRVSDRLDNLRHLAGRFRRAGRPLMMKRYRQGLVPVAPGTGVDLAAVAREFDRTDARFFQWGDQVWGRARLEDLTLYLSRPLEAHRWERWQKGAALAAAGWILLGCFLLPAIGQGAVGVALSIRWKLALVFVFVLFLPVAGSLAMGFRSLEDRRLLMEARIYRQAREILTGFDFQFSTVTADFEKTSRRLRDSPEMMQGDKTLLAKASAIFTAPARAKESGLSAGKTARASPPRFHMEIRDIRGDLLLFKSFPGAANSLDSFFDAFGRAAIIKRLGDRLKQSGETVNNPPDSFVERFFFSSYFGFATVLSRNDQVHIPQLGEALFFYYWDVIADVRQKVAFLLVFSPVSDWCRQFLGTRLTRRELPDRREFLILARENASGQTLPAGTTLDGNLETLFNRVKAGQDIITGKGAYRGTPCLIVGMPGRWLDGYSLVALMREAEIDGEIQRLKFGLLNQVLLGLLFAGAMGILLAEGFLIPVSEISSGLAALRRRDISYRVQTTKGDELGVLADSFNRMLEDLKEMEMAKVVQTAMIPPRFPDLPGYAGVLRGETASRLGGDYCDILPLDGGDVLLVIGDVTGHGVGAALLMAMVKAVVMRASMKNQSLPEMFLSLDDMIRHLLNKEMLMSFLAVRLSPATGALEVCNAGHPYPLVISADQHLREIQIPHRPLGVFRLAAKVPTVVDHLEPGETLILYTDGCCEARDAGGAMLSFDRLFALLVAEAKQALPVMFDRFWERWRDQLADGPLEDDCTMLMVRRESPGEKEGGNG